MVQASRILACLSAVALVGRCARVMPFANLPPRHPVTLNRHVLGAKFGRAGSSMAPRRVPSQMSGSAALGGGAVLFGHAQRENVQTARRVLPDPELLGQLQQLAAVDAATSILEAAAPVLDAAAPEAAAPVLDATAPILDPNTKYVLGPDGNPLIDPYGKPIVEDWYQLLVSLQCGFVKSIDATLRKIGVPQAFGWSIVMYTLFVKILTYPLQKSSTKSMTMMKVTQPKLNEITSSTLENEQKTKLMGALYDAVGANPLSGCLPILATFPIYFTLVSAWRRLAYENFPFYTESWLWIPSLAKPNPDFNLSFDWLFQFNTAGEPLMGWHDYLSYLVLPVILVVNTLILAFQNAKQERKEYPDFGITLFSVVLVGSICLDLPQAYGVYYLANQVFGALQMYVATESMRDEIPGYDEFERTGQFPESTLENLALAKTTPTSLHEAAQYGNKDAAISFLQDTSVDVDAWDATKVSPIGYAIAKGHMPIVSLLMDRGANIKVVDGVGHSAFHFAAFYNQPEVMKELVEISKDTYPDNSWAVLEDNDGITVLAAASVRNDPKMVALFETLGLTMLALPEQPELASDSTQLKTSEPTSLHMAAQLGNYDAIVAFLEEPSASVDAGDDADVAPIAYAVANGHLSTFQLLMSRGANMQTVDIAGRTLFHYATISGSVAIMKELVEATKESYPENSWALLKDQSGLTPSVAAMLFKENNPEMFNFFEGLGLIEEEAQPEAPLPRNLHEAAQSGNDEAVMALLEDEGTDIDARDEEKGIAAIGYAIAHGHVSTTKLLMSRGANIIATNGGHSLFHLAAFYSQTEIMKEVVKLNKDAYPDNSWAFLKTNDGVTPMDGVLHKKEPSMIDLFKGYGLDTSAELETVGVSQK